MKKSKESREQPRDRLSELPDSILFEIFWLLRMDDVVRTTILSKRWKNLWTTTPYLNFDTRSCNPRFVNRCLILWRGFRILKFKFCFGSYDGKSVYSDVDVWLRLAKENGIEELFLTLYSRYNDEVYVVPQHLYSCSSLKVLSLKGCNLQIHANVDVHWNQLKSLKIRGHFIDQKNLIDKVISGSPQLEVFILDLEDPDESISIQTTSLKKLSIDRFFEDESSTHSELRIWSPNLETLDIIGVPYAKYSLMDVSSLTHLTLCVFYNSCGVDNVDEILGQIYPTVQHVEKLTISNRSTEWLAEMEREKKKDLLSALSNVMFLTITGSDVSYGDILILLQIPPKLETLVIESVYFPGEYESDKDAVRCFLQGEINLPKSYLLQLRTVEITSNEDDEVIFSFIEILLKHASKLQKMVIRLRRNKNKYRKSPFCLCSALQKLLRLPRSSPTAKLIVSE